MLLSQRITKVSTHPFRKDNQALVKCIVCEIYTNGQKVVENFLRTKEFRIFCCLLVYVDCKLVFN